MSGKVNNNKILIVLIISHISMGPYLTQPKKDKDVQNGEKDRVTNTLTLTD